MVWSKWKYSFQITTCYRICISIPTCSWLLWLYDDWLWKSSGENMGLLDEWWCMNGKMLRYFWNSKYKENNVLPLTSFWSTIRKRSLELGYVSTDVSQSRSLKWCKIIAWLTGPKFLRGDLWQLEGLCPGGLCPGDLCLGRSLSMGGLCPWGSLSKGSLSKRVYVQGCLSGGVCQGEPPGQRPPCTVTRGQYASYWNAFLLRDIFAKYFKNPCKCQIRPR